MAHYGSDVESLGKLLRLVRHIIADEGLEEHEAKTRVMRRSSRQQVTGVTVNDKLALSRAEFRKLRAILHNCERRGLQSQNRAGHPNFAAFLRGKVAFAHMVAPERTAELWAALERALAKG